MSSHHDAMMRFCRAQADINSLMKSRADREKTVSERVRTYRSLLHDELLQNGLTCCEVIPDGALDPVYVRVKSQKTAPKLDADFLIKILRGIDDERLATKAEKYGHDLPRMLVAIVSDELKKMQTPSKRDKTTLSVSASKERGFTVVTNSTPLEVRRLANELLSASCELKSLRAESKKLRRPHEEEQDMVQEEVKATLKTTDPVNKVQRVHMTQDGQECVYFLRCKESMHTKSLGIRTAFPMLEEAIASSLESVGFDRGYSERLCLTKSFWEAVSRRLISDFEKAQAAKETSRLSLERGAPRCHS